MNLDLKKREQHKLWKLYGFNLTLQHHAEHVDELKHNG